MSGYTWKPIQPLSDDDKAIDLASMKPLYQSWRDYKKRLTVEGDAELAEFNTRLVRRLSIETGIIEQLYEIDRGTTEVLVANGFAEDLIVRTDKETDSAMIIDYLRDQEAAIHLVVDYVAQNRSLTKGLIHELHSILTQHQQTTDAVDQFGQRFKMKLLHGQYKQEPNNPKRSNGSLHEYCPPVHVDSEMDQLLGWFADYANDDPIIVSAWLHHRFTQIHPYQDGNGRLSRVLVTMILLKSELLPLIIDRDQKPSYIRDLEAADFGDLSKLAHVFARLERDAILQALSIKAGSKNTGSSNLTSEAIHALSDKFTRRREEHNQELRRVNLIAVGLRNLATDQLSKSTQEVVNLISGTAVVVSAKSGGSDFKNAYYFKFEVTTSAKKSGHFANFNEDHYFSRASITANHDRLLFVVSFHHSGRELSGFMEATAFAKLQTITDANQVAQDSSTLVICAKDPFVFTHQSELADIEPAFGRWLDAAFAIGLHQFGDRI